MTKALLLMGPLFDKTMQTLESTYEISRYWEASNPDELLDSLSQTCVGVVTDGGRGVEKRILEKLPNAKVVSVFGVGVDAVDLDYCKTNGIAVGNTPHVLSDDVADLAVGLALATCRQIVNADAYTRANSWAASGAFPLTTRMMGKKAGIFGMGSIGECLATRLTAFNMSVSYCNRNQKSNSPYRYVASLEQLASEVDFLFITAAATQGTIGAVNEAVLNKLGESGYLINVSRGTLVNEPALIDCLSNNKIAGAGLDVFHDEPNVPPALLTMSNVVLQPHIASGTFETREAMGDLMLENLSCHFSNKPLTASVV